MAVRKQQFNFEITRGRDFVQQFTLKNKATGAVIDLSGYTIKSQIRKSRKISSSIIKEFSINDDDANIGIFILSLTDTQALDMPDSKGYYDIVFTVGGVSETWFYGDIDITDHPTDISA